MELATFIVSLINLMFISGYIIFSFLQKKPRSPIAPPPPPTIQAELEQFQNNISKPSAFTLALKDFEDPLDAEEEEYFKTHNIPKRA